jgi:hypothetical protein
MEGMLAGLQPRSLSAVPFFAVITGWVATVTVAGNVIVQPQYSTVALYVWVAAGLTCIVSAKRLVEATALLLSQEILKSKSRTGRM